MPKPTRARPRSRWPTHGGATLLVGVAVLQLALAPAHAQGANFVGFRTSSAELEAIAAQAGDGIAPHAGNVRRVLAVADKPWPYGGNGKPYGHGTTYGTTLTANGGKRCRRLNDRNAERVLLRGGSRIFARVMAYFLTGDTSYAKQARDLIIEFTDSDGYRYVDGEPSYTGANVCLLDLSWITPLLIESAILLEHYPGWRDHHRNRLQDWLDEEVYAPIAAISRTRNNNWGNSASFAAWAIGHYIAMDDRDRILQEVHPVKRRVRAIEAKWSHRNMQLKRADGSWTGDSRCTPEYGVRPPRHGIQEHGGIPDELRRGSTGCEGTYLDAKDASHAYQQVAVSTLVHHAEAMRRHDRDQLYGLTLDSGVPALLQAIHFVINNDDRSPSAQWRWADWRIGALRVANRAFRSGILCDAIQGASGSGGIVGDTVMPFTAVTHSDVCA